MYVRQTGKTICLSLTGPKEQSHCIEDEKLIDFDVSHFDFDQTVEKWQQNENLNILRSLCKSASLRFPQVHIYEYKFNCVMCEGIM